MKKWILFTFVVQLFTFSDTNAADQFFSDIFFSDIGYKHTGRIDFNIINNSGGTKDVKINISYHYTQNSETYTTAVYYNVPAGISNHQLYLGILADATLDLFQNDTFKDEAYISGGIYELIVGSQSTVNQFIVNTYPPQNLNNFPVGASVLAGGAKVTGILQDWVSVMRSLNLTLTEYDLTGYNRIKFTANGTGVLAVLIGLSTTQEFNYHAYNINLTGVDNDYELYFSLFKELYGTNHTPIDPSKIKMVAFSLSKQFNTTLSSFSFEVKNIAFIPSNISAVDEKEVPKTFSLSQNYPNPFNPSTVIEFSAARRENLKLTIYNIIGQEIMTLLNGEVEPGVHKISIDASKLSSGVYIYKLSGSSINLCKKMIVTK